MSKLNIGLLIYRCSEILKNFKKSRFDEMQDKRHRSELHCPTPYAKIAHTYSK